MSEDSIRWNGPACPVCGCELDAESVGDASGITVIYSCREHGAISLADPFTSA
jgi:hypothetical protein